MGSLLQNTRGGFIRAFSTLRLMVSFSTGFQRSGEGTYPMVKIECCRKIRGFQVSTSYGCDSPARKSVAMQKHGIILCKPKMQAVHHHPCPVGPYLNFQLFVIVGSGGQVDTALPFVSESLGLPPSTVEGRGCQQGIFGSSRM